MPAKRAKVEQTLLTRKPNIVSVRPKRSYTIATQKQLGKKNQESGFKITGFFQSEDELRAQKQKQKPKQTKGENAGSQGASSKRTYSQATARTSVLEKKKKAASCRLQVQDSMLEADLSTTAAAPDVLSDAFSRLLSPSKRRKLAMVPDSQASGATQADQAPIPATPSRLRVAYDQTGSPAVQEVPSSLPYERYNQRSLTEPDTPTKRPQDGLFPSPPMTGMSRAAMRPLSFQAVPETQAPEQQEAVVTLTPPETTARPVYQDPPAGSVDEDSDSDDSTCAPSTASSGDDRIKMRQPLGELPATLIVTTGARSALTRESTSPDARRFEQLLTSANRPVLTEVPDEDDDSTCDEAEEERDLRRQRRRLEVPDSEDDGDWMATMPARSQDKRMPSSAEANGTRQGGRFSLLPESLLNDSLLAPCQPPSMPSFPSMGGSDTQAVATFLRTEDSLMEPILPPALSASMMASVERVSASPSPRKRAKRA